MRAARAVAAMVVAAAALGLVAVAARSGRPPTVTAISTPTGLPTPTATPTAGGTPTPRATASPRAGGSGWVLPGSIFVIVSLAGLAYLLGFWTWLLRRSRGGRLRPRQLPRVRADPPPDDPDPMVTGALSGAVDAGLRRIDEGEPQDAVVSCWVLLERAAADAGVIRRPAETPAELTRRVLAAHRVSPEPLVRLAELYREARYSTHPIGEPVRDGARAALERVRRELAGEPVDR